MSLDITSITRCCNSTTRFIRRGFLSGNLFWSAFCTAPLRRTGILDTKGRCAIGISDYSISDGIIAHNLLADIAQGAPALSVGGPCGSGGNTGDAARPSRGDVFVRIDKSRASTARRNRSRTGEQLAPSAVRAWRLTKTFQRGDTRGFEQLGASRIRPRAPSEPLSRP